MAMSMEVSLAPGMRAKERRCSVESTTAMFMGTEMEWAWAAQAVVRYWAAARVKVGRAVTAGTVGVGMVVDDGR